jgi:hypothetical protein
MVRRVDRYDDSGQAHQNQSKQSKGDSGNLSDYVNKKLVKAGTPVKKGKLPKNLSRVIFKR